ncbi:MAG TPA: STAS/SEC14 domain-containing protein, partial [bacterium]|nr:STAS/SEC14 domain-containing protein [bacterium]
MSIDLTPGPQQRYLHLRLSDRLHAADYEHFVPAVDEWIEQHGRARLLVELHD